MTWYTNNTNDPEPRLDRFLRLMLLWQMPRPSEHGCDTSGEVIMQAVENTIWN